MNLPVLAWHYEIVVLAAEDHTGLINNYKVITVYPFGYIPEFIESYTNEMQYDGTWTGWAKNATETPPQVYDLPLTDGFSTWGLCHYWKGQNGIVTLNVNISSTPETTAGNEAVIGNLPEGFRPTGHVIAAAYCNHRNDLNSKPGYIFVDYLGAVRMRGDTDWTMGHASVTFFAT